MLTRNLILAGMLCISLKSLSQQFTRDADSVIGKPCPDFLMENMIGSPTSTTKVSDFKGKWLILNFWATWCAPCVSELPRLDSIQRMFGDRMQIMCITYQEKTVVRNFLKQRKKVLGTGVSFPIITGDTSISDYFPHAFIPHSIWINPSGVVVTVTSGQELSLENAKKMILNQPVSMEKKKDSLPDFSFDKGKPLFLNNNGGQPGDIISYEILSKGYKSGLSASIIASAGNRILVTNCLLQDLYQTAYGGGRSDLNFNPAVGFPHNRTIIDIKDSTSYTYTKEHLNAYCYDIVLPHLLINTDNRNLLYGAMRLTLQNSLPYEARVIKKKMLCLVLIRTKNFKLKKSISKPTSFDYDAFTANMKNYPFPDFVSYLRYYFLQLETRPIIDETNLTDSVDLSLTSKLSDPKSLAKSLQVYGLDLVEEYRDIEMLQISDKLNPQ